MRPAKQLAPIPFRALNSFTFPFLIFYAAVESQAVIFCGRSSSCHSSASTLRRQVRPRGRGRRNSQSGLEGREISAGSLSHHLYKEETSSHDL